MSNDIPSFNGSTPGPTIILNNLAEEVEFFKCFFPDELFEFVTEESNRYGLLKHHPPLSTLWEETNISEI